MKSRDGKSRRREEKKKEDQKRESLRRKKIQVREKVGKSRNTVFFPMICGSGGPKSRLAKAAGADCVTGAALRIPGITFSWQAQYFRQVEWKNRKTHRYEAVSSALNFPFLKEVSLNCCVFDAVKFKN